MTVEDAETGCWVFQGSDNSVGYGVVAAGGKFGGMLYAHRVTYEYFIAEIPAGLVLDHLCRNRKCCNPWHLEPVTHRVNLLRGEGPPAVSARKEKCPQGHAYDEQNTYRYPDGTRRCKTCAAIYQRNLRRKRKAS